MAKYLGDYLTFIQDILGSTATARLPRAARVRRVDEAVRQYSHHKPLIQTYDITGDGTATYSLPSDWVDNFSELVSVEYPADYQDPVWLKLDDVFIYNDGSAYKLRFPEYEPSSSETVRIRYTIPHTLDEDSTTIPDTDFEAVANLATAVCAMALAGRLIAAKDSHSAGEIQIRTQADEYRSFAKELIQLGYYKRLGISEKEQPLAYKLFDLDPLLPSVGLPELTHSRR
jgi:hypothetical protein